MKIRAFLFLACSLVLSGISACNSSSKDLLDLAVDPPQRKTINRDIVGVNNFFVNPEFGSIEQQFAEIRNTLGLRHVRVLFAWSDGVQASPGASRNYSFYDDIIDAIPAGMDVVIVLAHTPAWMGNSANWIDGNPRKTWVERWLKPTVARYAGRRGVIGWEVWNEPDLVTVPTDAALELVDPAKYFELLSLGAPVIRTTDPTRLVLNAATSAIAQSFPAAKNYNERLQDLGAESLVDVWNVHYYSEQFENVVRGGGVAEFLNSLSVPIWITESGKEGINQHLAYAETVWPFLTDNVDGIERFYWYQLNSREPAGSSFGLRTADPAFPVSDLYIWLRDNK
ncbi:MAG: cellulase family glycosylhydrolase [Deltaproteobacteria bacterium]|nr:cellulase family glycosylhydrolase [Deltaproteobacteria bacterium]